MKASDSIQSVKGVGGKTAAHLQRLGIETIGDFMQHFPRDYRSYEEPLRISDRSRDDRGPAAYSVHITSRAVPVSRGRASLTILKLQDGGASCNAVWFHSPFVAKRLTPGSDFIFYGSMTTKGSRRSLEHPDIFTPEEYDRIRAGLQPVYALTEGITQKFFHKTMRLILDSLELSDDPLPLPIRMRYHLAEYNFALQQIHFPDHYENLRSARERLVFDEFFLFALRLKLLRKNNQKAENAYPVYETERVQSFIENLPYKLTGAQLRVFDEIRTDLAGPHAMNRLIQGDVGSGKTALAALAMLAMAFAGHQAALMAPTEVLAVQHFEKLQKLFSPYGIQTVLLTGSMTAAQKRKVYAQMEAKEADIIIGTQALFQEKAVYADLGLIVTDEQHRFGVAQRQRLADKSQEKTPHILVMSATPIPRTLAIILYSDLDLSALDEKPQNRLPIKTAVVGTEYRSNAYRFMEKEVRMGHQVYIICPMVEQSEQIDAENVIDYTEKLKHILPEDIRIEFVHGKMKSEEKNRIMQRFSDHQTDILVSTTVIEVGVDVPSATVILIENSERFGLAQLHQLRGRVGRGDAQSYCIYMYGQTNAAIQERLEILKNSRDGFEIAAADLRLRGPGDMFGIMQSGAMQFAIGDVFADSAILLKAGEAADQILKEDPSFTQPQNIAIKELLAGQTDPEKGPVVL